MKKFIIIGGLVLAVAIVFILAFSNSESREKKFNTIKVEKGEVVDKAIAIGQIEPKNQISVKSKISGIVGQVQVEMGDSVSAGDLLLEIIPDPTPQEFAEAKRQSEIDSVTWDNKKSEFNRAQELLQKNMISRQEFDRASKDYKESELKFKLSQERLSLIVQGKTDVAGRKVESIIKSPISGRILERKVNVGDPVVPLTSYQEGTELFTMANMDELVFKGTVDEIDVGRLKEGMTVLLKIGALPGDTLGGILHKISPKARQEENATVFDVEIKMKQKGGPLLRAGYSANAEIIIQKKENILIIPERLVEFVEDTAFVQLAVGTEKTEKRKIKTGLSDGLNIEVAEGLKEGELLAELPPKEIK